MGERSGLEGGVDAMRRRGVMVGFLRNEYGFVTSLALGLDGEIWFLVP